MNANKHFVATVLAALFLTGGSLPCRAESAMTRDQVTQWFEQAIAVQGKAYHILRTNIVAQGSGAVDFLKAQTLSTNLHARVVARGMLSWIAEPETNVLRTRLFVEMVDKASVSHVGVERGLGQFIEFEHSDAQWRWRGRPPPQGLEKLDPPDPFLLEVALKGLSPLGSDQRERVSEEGSDSGGVMSQQLNEGFESYAFWAQCLAAAQVGGHEGADVIPVLVELLKSPRRELRTYSTIGLKGTRRVEAIEPLLGALSDADGDVQVSAYLGLIELTGQDFRSGVRKMSPTVTAKQIDDEVRKQFREWWQENKERLLKSQEEKK
jgi:hypothetical protein